MDRIDAPLPRGPTGGSTSACQLRLAQARGIATGLRWMRAALHASVLAMTLVVPAALAFAGHTVVVTQQGRRFSVSELTLSPGDTIRFTNDDEFLHQIYVKALGFATAAGQEPGEHVDVLFPTAGTFEVRCEIHPKMLLTVTAR